METLPLVLLAGLAVFIGVALGGAVIFGLETYGPESTVSTDPFYANPKNALLASEPPTCIVTAFDNYECGLSDCDFDFDID